MKVKPIPSKSMMTNDLQMDESATIVTIETLITFMRARGEKVVHFFLPLSFTEKAEKVSRSSSDC